MVKTPSEATLNSASKESEGESSEGLKRSIPFSILMLLAINAIIGTGIFFVPGIAAKIAGPASLLSWVLVAILALFIAACFAELVSMFPKSGGVYEYTKNAFGEFTGFMVGWTSWIVANITIAMLAIGALDYLTGFIAFPMWQKIIIALIFVALMNFVSYRGIDMSVKVLLVFSVITILSLWALFSWGVYYFDISKLNPVSIFPKVSIAIAMLYIMETFFGWETVSYLAEETKDPRRVIPKVMMLGTLAVTLLAIGVVTIVLGAVHWEQLANSISPLVDAATLFMGQTGAKVIAILVFLNIIGGAAAWIVVTPRLVYALARDGLLPDFLSKLHPTYKTPYMAILLQTILTAIIILSGSYQSLLEMLLPLAIFMYAMVVVSVTVLRFTQPDNERTFKVPGGKVTPILAALVMLFLAGGIEIQTIITGAAFVLIGIPLYLIKGVESKPEVIKEMLEATSGLSALTYSFIVDKKTRSRVHQFFGDMQDRRILHMGSNVGVLTAELAEIVGPRGQIFATEISQKNIKRAQKHAARKGHKNILFIQEDAENRHNLHPSIQKVHGATSIGVLGYLSDPDAVLHEMNKRMLKNGRIYFIDYDRIFKLMHAPNWLKDDELIRKKFAQHGFHVNVRREKGLLWDTIHIYGWKEASVK